MKIFARKSFVVTVLLVLSGVALGQTATLEGTVEIWQKSGEPYFPVKDAMVKIIRTDIIDGKISSAKTNKRGEFAFAKLPLGSVYLICVSAPNVKADCRTVTNTGMEGLVLYVEPGDGGQITDQEMGQLSAKSRYHAAADYRKDEKYDLAVAAYTDTLKLDPNHVDAYHYRGHSYSALKNYDLAVADFTSALKTDES